MAEERPLYTLYKNLKAQNYDVPDDYDRFENALTRDGKAGADNRHAIYENLKAQNFDVPDNYERFYSALFEPRSKDSSRAKGGSVPMTAKDKARFMAGAQNIVNSTQQTINNTGRYNKMKQRKQKQQSDFGRVNIGTNRTPFSNENNVVKDDALGTYITSDNEETDNIIEAQQKQAALDEYGKNYQQAVDAGEIPSVFDVRDKNGNYDLQENVGKDGTYLTEEGAQNQLERKLEDAYARRKEIEDAIAEDNRKYGNPLLSYSGSIGAGNGRDAESSDYRNKLATSLALVKQQIGALEAVKQYPTSSWGEDAWKALDNTVFTAKTWDFGLSDFATMGQMERIKTKMDNGVALTDSDKMLLKSKVGADAAAALEDEKMGNIYRWTKIAGQSLPFMMDFFLTGGYGGITKGISKAAIKYAAKRGMGKVSAAILKNTGVVAGDIIGSYAMATTTQAMKTGADVMQRHMGTLYQDENGNYAFGTFDENGNLLHEGGENIGKSLYKGLTSAMVENYTEKLFGHNYGFKKGAINFMEKHGMARTAEFFKNIGQKGWYAGSKKWMEKFGINGFAEEVMEEEIGIPLHALLDGEGKVSDLLDARQQLDIIGGMAISVGSMYAMGLGMKPIKGVYNRAQYYRFKHKVDVADSEAQLLFGDSWADVKEQIDNATNEKMGGVLYNILQSTKTMTKEQQDAAVDYARKLMTMRGYNLAKTAEMQARQTTGEPVTDEEQRDNEMDDAYSEGHNADGETTHSIQLEQNASATALANMLGISEEQLHNMSDEALEAMTGQSDKLDQAIYDYQMSTAKYQGVMDNANDKVDMAARQAAMLVDQTTDLSRGSVRNATIKATQGAEDYGVYIISGNLATHDDGTIDISGSDKMILYYDPTTGHTEYADPSRFASLGDEVPADEVKAQAVADAKEKAIREIAGIIDGKVDVGTQFTVTDEQGNQHTYEVLADNGDGTAMITIDGNVPTTLVNGETVQMPVSFDDLQQMKDTEDEKTMAAARQQRAELEAQREQQKKDEEQKQAQNENHLRALYNNLLDNDGKVVMGTVHDGKHDDQQAFIVGVNQSNKKPYVVFMNEDGTFTKPRSFENEQVEIGESVDFDTFKAMLPEVAEEEEQVAPTDNTVAPADTTASVAADNTTSTAVEDNSGEGAAVPSGTAGVENVTETSTATDDNTPSTETAAEEGQATPAMTLEDGTLVPMKEDGNPDFSKMTAQQTAEFYDSQFGEDADGVISGWVADAKNALDKANRMTVKGKNFVEQKASKEAKDKAIADAKQKYESAKAIKDAYDERILAKEEGTPEGRKNLIEKARRKYNRLKGKVKDNTEELAKLYSETVGSLLHRLYDGTGIDVLDTVPLTAEEYVASNLGAHSLNYEGTETSKGVKQETGLSREDFAKTRLLAKDGKGTTIDKMVDKLWNERPSNLEELDTQDIRNALLDLIMSGRSASEYRNYVQDMRIDQAEKLLEEEQRAAENAKFAEEQRKAEEERKKAEEEKVKAKVVSSDSFNPDDIDYENNYVVIHQTLAENIDSILKNGLRTIAGLNATSLFANAQTIKDLLKKMADGHGHRGSDALIVMTFPKSMFGDGRVSLDDISTTLIEQGKAKDFTVPSDFIANVVTVDANNTTSPADNGETKQATEAPADSEGKQFPDKLREDNQEGATEVPEDATDEKPFGEQLGETDLPFSARDNTEAETPGQRAANVERNRVDNIKTVDNIVGKKTRKALERIAKMMGAKIQWQYTDSMGNGWYEADTNTLFLTLDSSITEGVQFIFGHEMTHEIKTKNPAAYDELRELVTNMMGEDAFNAQTAATQKKYNEHGIMYLEGLPAYEEEVVADQIGYWLRDLNYAHTLAMKMSHPLLAKLHEIINRIRMAFYGTEYTDTAKLIMRSIEQAYVKTANGTSESSSTGERFSLKEANDRFNNEIEDFKNNSHKGLMHLGTPSPILKACGVNAEEITLSPKVLNKKLNQHSLTSDDVKDLVNAIQKPIMVYKHGENKPNIVVITNAEVRGNKLSLALELDKDGNVTELNNVSSIHDKDAETEVKRWLSWDEGYLENALRWVDKEKVSDWLSSARLNSYSQTEYNQKLSSVAKVLNSFENPKVSGENLQNGPKFSLKMYHGSGADFTEFDFDHMSEGAGSQAFGWGGYVTSSEKIGKSYADVTRHKPTYIYEGKDMSADDFHDRMLNEIGSRNESMLNDFIFNLEQYGVTKAKDILKKGDLVSYKDLFRQSLGDTREYANDKINAAETLLALKGVRIKKHKSSLYEVNIPDDNGKNYLEWDKPLTDEQQEMVYQELYNLPKEQLDKMANGDYWFKNNLYYILRDVDKERAIPVLVSDNTLAKKTMLDEYDIPNEGSTVYRRLKEWLGSDKAASKLLSSAGYTGIKYPAGTIMGGAEEGDTNYVIFKPEDMQIAEHTKFSLKDNKADENLQSASITTVDNHPLLNAIHTLYTKGKDFAANLFNRKYFDVAKTPDFMKEVGLTGDKFTIRYGVISRHFGKDEQHDFTEEEWKQLPKALSNPIIITEYYQDENQKKQKGYRIYTPLTLSDGSYVVVSAEVKNAGKNLEINAINTIFGRNAVSDVHDKIVWKNPKITPEQMSLLGENNPRQYPSTQELSAAKIDNSSETAKENGEKFSLKDDKTLVGVHNITEEKLRKALKLGGFANPSVAVIDTGKSAHNSFGEISFIAPSALVDKRTGGTAGTWTTDAYTQRYPSVERQMSEKGYEKFEKWVDGLDYPDSAKMEIKRQAKDALEDNRDPAWELMYLKEKGIDIEGYDSKVNYLWEDIIEEHPSVEDILESMKSDPKLNEDVTKLAKSEITAPTWRNISQEVSAQMSEELGRRVSTISPKVRAKTKEIFERDYAPSLFNKDGSPKKADVKKVVAKMVQQYEDTKQYSFYKSKVRASSYVHNNGLYADYIRWQENKLDDFGTKNRLFRGYKNDGTRKYVPETLENVSKAMRDDADGQTNGSEYTTFGSFIAKLANRVDSTDEMRANKDKLSSNEDKQDFYEKWEEVYYDLAKFLYNDVAAGEQRLHDIVTKSDPKKYAKKEYGITLTPTFMKNLDALKKAVREELKSNYFETKFERPVHLNEFAAAVVPKDLGADVRKGLEESGLRLYDYDAKKEGDRQRAFDKAIHSGDNIRFSLAGERGAANMDRAEEVTTRLDNLSVARKMEEEKKDVKAIKLATGWERGADGKWRYEIPDIEYVASGDANWKKVLARQPWAKELEELADRIFDEEKLSDKEMARFDELCKENDELYKTYKESDVKYLDDYAPNDALYKAYPKLKQTRVVFVNNPSLGWAGKYNQKDNTIFINGSSDFSYRSTLAHEIQHAIQDIEGFAQGGSQRQAATAAFQQKLKDDYIEAIDHLDEVCKKNGISRFAALDEDFDASDNTELKDAISSFRAAQKKILASPYDRYLSLAGEVEARNVQKRMGMTDEERRNSLASETEDVAREDQIFLGVGDTKFSIKQFGTDIADASVRTKNLMDNEKIISRRIGSRAQAQARVLETISRASDEFRRANRASAKSGQDTWEKDRALGHVVRASYGTGSFLTEEEIKEITSGKVGNGQENQVYSSKDGKTVIKLNNLLMVDREFRFNEFLDRIKAHNEFAPDDMYTPLGFALNQEGDFCLVLEQPYVKGEPATQDEIDNYMEEHGYDLAPIRVSADEVGAGWSNGEFEIWDTKPRNVLKDKNGDLHFIDTVIQHTFIDGHNDKLRFSLRVDQYQHDLAQWKKDNNLPKDAERPAIPVREPNETAVDFAKRVKEYRKQMALWKTAPQYEDHLLTDDTAQGQFNLELQRGSVLARIALQDSMLAVRKAQEAIMKEVGVDRLNIAEDAYTAENRSHGKGKNEFEEYNDEFLQPLRKAYNALMKKLGKSYDNVKIYMVSKHGLERNAHIAFKKALDADFEKPADRIAAYNAYKGDMDRLDNDVDFENGKIGFTTWRQKDNAIRTKYAPSYLEYRYDKMGITQDYSGLSALFEGADFEEAAAELVRDVETLHPNEAYSLWVETNAATKKILRDSYKAGMMTKDVYEYVRGMYEHYIPLRGWGDTNADQVWNYMGGGKGAFNQTLKKANGRKSLADDPIAYIENMAESGILMNNKNWVKQHLLLLAENHPTSLLNVSKAWYVKTVDAQGNEEWIPASPNITANMDSQQVKNELEAFEKKMEQMKQKGDATQKREHLEITYPQTKGEEREHEVRVMRDGEEYVIYVNGDPQLAQAMNNTRAHRVREGLEHDKFGKLCAWVGRKMAAAYTSLSPLFIPANYTRDFTMTLASTAIREDRKYNWLLWKNMATKWNTFPLVLEYQSGKLRGKVLNGTASKAEQMFYDYMMNGGETGFVSSLDVEDLKKKFKNELKDMNRMALNPKKVGHIVMDSIETLNRAIEDSNRFMVYMSSIQYGRSIEEAVNDAKDVTLNFNRKGTGEHSWQTIRNAYLFINPAVQSLQTLGALAKHHPFKFTAVTTAWLASGMIVPLVNNLLMDLLGGDDDKDKYWSFSKWDRRNNFIMWVPFTHNFIKIPLAQEFRGFYGVGDMVASKLYGNEKAQQSWEDYGLDLMGQVVDMLPLDPTGYDGNILVSLMPNAIRPFCELAFNVDFTGKPLFKDSEYNKYDPNFTKAYAGTPDWLVRVSRMVNAVGNDYPDFQQNAIDKFGGPRYNLNNPAVVHHVLSSYLGGAYTMGSQILGVATKALNGDEIKMADVPLASKFVGNPDDRPVSKKQGDNFWIMRERYDRAARLLSQLKKKAKVDGDYSTLDVFFGSDEYKQYKLDDAEVKKYQEERKKEQAEEMGDDTYQPKRLTADAVYQRHSTPKDDFEDMKVSQIYPKVRDIKKKWEALADNASPDAPSYYEANAYAIKAATDVEYLRGLIEEDKNRFLTDGEETYNEKDMADIRKLREQALDKLEAANKVIVANQKARAKKK